MPFEIIRNDLANMRTDAIVNTANPKPVVGAGTDAAIHQKAGPQLLEARQKIGNIRPGSSAITPAFGLDARYVIHTVGPVWQGGFLGEQGKLRSCYDSALHLALEWGCDSIAFPLISTGTYGFPKNLALQTAIAAFNEFLTDHEMEIYLVVWDQDSLRLSEKRFHSIASYIDERYVQTHTIREYRRESAGLSRCPPRALEEITQCAPSAAPVRRPKAPTRKLSLKEMLQQTDAGFTETLLKLIDQSGQKDSTIYKKALLSKQHFSKIRSNPDYRPTKATAISLALALELDLDQTKDLIGRAGYALTDSSKSDIIIRYFIENKIYDLVEINIALYEFDQSLLGS